MPKIAPGHSTGIGTINALRVYSQALNLAVRNLDKITIAAINSAAIQTGLSLALSCDFRLASSNARLGSATLRYALLPDEGGHYLLVEHLGLAKALDFTLRKKIVGADAALALGLVGEVTSPGGPDARRHGPGARDGRGTAGGHAPAQALALRRLRGQPRRLV